MALRDGSLAGRIEWRDSAGKWAGDQSFPLISNDCFQLARAMGFALAVQIQLLAKTGAAANPEIAPLAETAPPVAAPSPTHARTTRRHRPSGRADDRVRRHRAARPATHGPRPVFAVGAGPSVGFGMSSAPVLLGRVFGAVSWQHVSLELGARVSLPSTTRRADGAGFSQQHLLLSAASCVAVSRWNACLLANAGQVRMAGEDIDRPSSAQVPVVEAGARVAFIQLIGPRVFLTAHADGLVRLTRWTASLDQTPVWSAPRFAAAIGIDTGVRFP